MLEQIFSGLGAGYIAGAIEKETSFYFTFGDLKKTVIISRDSCRVADGKIQEEVDCVCKTDRDFFLKIWNEGYRPGMTDFMSGKIKSNDPFKLKMFLSAFGK